MLDILGTTLLVLASLIFARRRSFRYLSALQQDEYSAKRFLDWYFRRQAFDKRASIVALFAIGVLFFTNRAETFFVVSSLGAIALFILAQYEIDPRVEGKIKLVFTKRAQRIYFVAAGIFTGLLITLISSCIHSNFSMSALFFWLALLILFQLLPFFLLLAVAILVPAENAAQRHYLGEASKIVRNSGAIVIGITGSYGKTSTKNALGEILQITAGSTFWPKKGINTLMGNTREIRSALMSAYKYAIIEMGAYRRGSIEALCRLAPPKVGIITAIGLMHLERFGDEDSIYKAKTELARAVPQDGILICNGDNAGARRAAQEYRKNTTLLYGFSEQVGPLDCLMYDIKMSASGSSFKLRWQGQDLSGSTGLLGKPALSNVMAAFVAACALGANPKFILAAIYNLKPVDNRLSLEKNANVIYLKDAYNSNPTGFEAALDVLSGMPGKRKILMTPGMIELGDRQESENRRLAEKAAKVCDLVLIVGATNRNAIKEGLGSASLDQSKVICFDQRDSALAELTKLQQDGDVILIENDLGDWYEDASSF